MTDKILIDNQTAIDALGEEPYVWEEDNDAIKAVPSAQPEQRWIPCSERLPEPYGEMRWNNE